MSEFSNIFIGIFGVAPHMEKNIFLALINTLIKAILIPLPLLFDIKLL